MTFSRPGTAAENCDTRHARSPRRVADIITPVTGIAGFPVLKATRSIGFWLGLAVGAALLWLAARSVDLDALGAALRQASLGWSAPFLVLLFGFYALKALRWGILVEPLGRIPFRLLFRSIMLGYASNAFLPAQLGDIVRAVVASREMGLPAAPLLTTVVVERACDLIVVAGLLGVLLLVSPEVPAGVVVSGAVVLAGCLLALGLLWIYARRTDSVLRVAAGLLGWVGQAQRTRLLGWIRSAAAGATAIAQLRPFLGCLWISVAKWLLMAGCNLVSFWALGIDVPPGAALLVLAATALAMTLPSAPGYVGAIQVAYVSGLAPFGVPATEAIAASLYFHALSYASVVAVGAAYLHAGGYRLADLRQSVQRSR
jgi:uncharacterized protein (TIRG00374 family)